jgi:hypothetical protein
MGDRLLAGLVVVPFLLGAAAAPSSRAHVAFTFQDPQIVESSGLVVQDGLFLTTNDSGDAGRVFAVDPGTGDTVGVTSWSDDPTDVEALAPARGGSVWVGDIGDNSAARDSVEVTRVPVGAGDRTDDGESFELVYPDGAHNAETLLSHPRTGRLFVATKSVFGAQLFAAPRRLDPDGPNRLSPIGSVLPIATDGAFFPDGRHLVVRDYSQAAVYSFPDLERVATFRLPEQEQGEGIAVAADGSVYVSSEGQRQPVLRVPLPADVRRALAGPAPSGSPSASPGSALDGLASDDVVESRPAWPWFLTGWLALALLVALAWGFGRRPRG